MFPADVVAYIKVQLVTLPTVIGWNHLLNSRCYQSWVKGHTAVVLAVCYHCPTSTTSVCSLHPQCAAKNAVLLARSWVVQVYYSTINTSVCVLPSFKIWLHVLTIIDWALRSLISFSNFSVDAQTHNHTHSLLSFQIKQLLNASFRHT